MAARSTTRTIAASTARVGMWIAHHDPRFDQRIVEIAGTRDARLKFSVDFGNGGEPGTEFFDPKDRLLIKEGA